MVFRASPRQTVFRGPLDICDREIHEHLGFLVTDASNRSLNALNVAAGYRLSASEMPVFPELERQMVLYILR
jgi:hypothetical protein